MPVSNWIDHLPDRERDALLAVVKPRVFNAGTLIFNRNEQPQGLYLIRSGSALFQLDGYNGKSLLLKIIRENELFGETVAYDGKAAPIAVQARSRLETGFISSDRLEALRKTCPEIERSLAAAAVANLRAALVALEELTLIGLRERARARLAALCADAAYPLDETITLDITQGEFASMIGASRQATNAVLGEFENAGWLRRQFRAIACFPSYFIVDPVR